RNTNQGVSQPLLHTVFHFEKRDEMNHRFSRVFLNLVNIICFNMLRGCKACSNPFDHIIRALFYEFFTLYFRFFSEGKSNRSYDGINTKGEHMCALRGYKQQEKQLKQGDGYQGE